MTLVPTMSAGIRSGVNWMRLNSTSSTCPQSCQQLGLAQAGDAFEQHMAPQRRAMSTVLDELLLADDDLADLVAGRLKRGGEFFWGHGSNSVKYWRMRSARFSGITIRSSESSAWSRYWLKLSV